MDTLRTSRAPSFSSSAVKPLSRIRWDRNAARHFETDDVPTEDLHSILSLATQAPSAANLQPWRFVVVQDQELRDRLAMDVADRDGVSEAPVVVVACGLRSAWRSPGSFDPVHGQDFAGFEESRLMIHDGGPAYHAGTVWLHRQVMVAFTYMMIAAEALGWDTAPMERFDAAAVGDALGLPDDVEVVALLAIGRLQERDDDLQERQPLEELVSEERWGVAWSDPVGNPVRSSLQPGFVRGTS